MTTPPSSAPNEPARREALERLGVLDTPIESKYNGLTRLAQGEFGVRAAAVSLVADDRQWFKAVQGLDVCETSRDVSFCGHTILQQGVFVVEDATRDERFVNNPLVTGEPFIRAYAGAPILLRTGEAVGAFCLIHDEPRSFDDRERKRLEEYAAVTAHYLEDQWKTDQQVFAESQPAERVRDLVDPATRLWTREGILEVARRVVESSGKTRAVRKPEGCGIMLVRCGSGEDRVMGRAAVKLIDGLRDLDTAGRYSENTFMAVLADCSSQRHAEAACSAVVRRLTAAAEAAGELELPPEAFPVEAAVAHVSFAMGSSIEDGLNEALYRLGSCPVRAAA